MQPKARPRSQGDELRPGSRVSDPVPPIHRRRPSYGWEIVVTRAAIACTLAMTLAAAGSLVNWLVTTDTLTRPRLIVAQAVLIIAAAVLAHGSLVHQLARLGWLQRARDFRPATSDELQVVHDGPPPRLAVLVPSYQEDPRLVRMTLLSAALQEHPHHRVVLLIDDPPDPTGHQTWATLESTRRIPGDIQRRLGGPASRFDRAHRAFRGRRSAGPLDLAAETERLADLWDEAAAWFEDQAALVPGNDHVERFFRREVLARPATQHRSTAMDLCARARSAPPGPDDLDRQHRRLASLFAVDMAYFERKRYANLAHAPNKAMNLNAYLQLLGTTHRVERRADGNHLVPDATGHVHVPDADFVITLDADSMLLPGYALRLGHVMQEPGNERVGLVQTPYSAFPEAPVPVEEVAGATTDVMCLVHQGATHFDAAYWVGANALLRTTALRDIAEEEPGQDHGRPVTRYIQDRTLVEDTDSTVDLLRHGWRVVNYPARLAYSATPPDFGSLLIQRRRWADGGLLILPRLLQHLRRRRPGIRALPGVLMQVNYLTSIASVNVALLVLMAYPFDGAYAPSWLPLLAVPYFGMYGRDLLQSGYRLRDVVRVYALTLLLIPVHLGGTLRSLWQACTGQRRAFGRTPKVPSRTPVPALYVVAVGVLLVHWLVLAASDLAHDRNARAVFTTMNVGLLAYAVTRFMGWRSAAGDLWLRLTGRAGVWATRTTGQWRAHRRARQAARRPWARSLVWAGRVSLVPVVVVVALVAVLFLRVENAEVEGLDEVPFPRMNVLVVGTDGRGDLSPEERRELSLGDFEGARADTLFVLSVRGDRAALVSFPRDLYVRRCDGSHGRINEALEIDGPTCLVDAVRDVSGVPVSHYVQVDFRGLMEVVDAVGGVPMTLDRPIVDDKTGARLPAGPQRLSAREALAFVRVRSIDDDIGRIGRQQEFLASLASEVAKVGTLTDPLALWRVSGAAAKALTVDRGMGPVDFARLGFGVPSAASGRSMPTVTVPTETRVVDGEQVEVVKDAAATRLFRRVADGSVLEGGPKMLAGTSPVERSALSGR